MLDLMGGSATTLEPLPGRLVRHPLTAGAWVDVIRGWVHGSDAVFETLLTEHYRPELGEGFVTAGMCLYRDGRDSVAWHGDTLGRSAKQDTMVAIVSFGSPRNLMLRPRAGGP